MSAIQVLEYLDASGRSPFRRWFDDLDATAAAKIGTYLYRLEQGNFSRVGGVGSGVFELRIDFGPGFRVYFGKDGETVVILLGGSAKKRSKLRSTQHIKRGRTTGDEKVIRGKSWH